MLAGITAGQTSRVYAKRLNEAIQLGGEALLPEIRRLELRGQGGAKSATALIDSDRFYQRMGASELPIAGVALSHGYQSTFAWIADLIGHVLLESRTDLGTTEMEGLVLIDEIDLYLHPVRGEPVDRRREPDLVRWPDAGAGCPGPRTSDSEGKVCFASRSCSGDGGP